MKNMFKKYGSLCSVALLLCFYLASCGKTAKIENDLLPNVTSSDRADKCELIITGRVINTKNLEPIEGALVEGTSFMAETDEEGIFSVSIEVEEDGIVDDIKVTKDDFLIKEFKAFYGSLVQLNSCPALTNVSWEIGLSEQQEGVWAGPRDGAWYKIMDTVATRYVNDLGIEDTAFLTNVYTIDIRRGSFEDPQNVRVSPDHGRAVGTGIPIEISNFVIVSFDIQVGNGTNGLQQAASSRGEEVFLKPLDIRFPLPTAVNSDDFAVIDLDDLGIELDAISLDNEGNIVYFATEDGRHYIVFNPLLINVVLPALEALASGATLEEINQIIIDGSELLAENGEGDGIGSGSTMIDTEAETLGRIAGNANLANCNCASSVTRNFTASLDGFENITINFPLDVTENQRALTLIILRALLGISGSPNQTADLNVEIDIKCSTVNVTSQEIVRTVTGTVLGFPFTYSGTDRLETTVVDGGICPTTTPCHQTCPG